MEFRTIDVKKDRETIISFRKDSYRVSFGSDEGFGDEDGYVKRIEERVQSFPDGLVLVEDNGKPIGQIELQIVPYEGNDIGYVNLFYLTPENRGKGLGQHLLAYAESFFNRHQVKAYHLRVSPTNPFAVKFYEKCGLRVLEEETSKYVVWRMVKDLSSSNIYLKLLEMKDAEAILDIKRRNRDFFQPFEPIRDETHFTLEGQENEIANGMQGAQNDQSYSFGIFLKENDELIGRIALTGIARGFFQNAFVGYYIDQTHNGKGYATAAVSLCVEIAFSELKLHRVEASVMPRNLPSIRVLEKAGFRHEGLAKTYLKINGTWEDHKRFAITAEQ